jgi:hypothetical protein
MSWYLVVIHWQHKAEAPPSVGGGNAISRPLLLTCVSSSLVAVISSTGGVCQNRQNVLFARGVNDKATGTKNSCKLKHKFILEFSPNLILSDQSDKRGPSLVLGICLIGCGCWRRAPISSICSRRASALNKALLVYHLLGLFI